MTYKVKKVEIIIPPKIVDPTANLEPSPAPGPMFPITKKELGSSSLRDSKDYHCRSELRLKIVHPQVNQI